MRTLAVLLSVASLRRIVRWTCGKADFVKSLQGGPNVKRSFLKDA